MKVHELIEELEKHPGHFDIVLNLGEDISYDESISITCRYPIVLRGRKGTDTVVITDGT